MRFNKDTVESLDAEAEERDLSRSEYLREIVRNRGMQIDVQERIQELETENERLKREKRKILSQREDNSELVEYAKSEREIRRQEEQRRREREAASVFTRLRWWIRGRPIEEWEKDRS